MNDVQKATGEEYWIPQKRKELLEVIRSASGMWIEAIAQNQPQQGETGYSGVPSGTVRIAASIVNRSSASILLKRVLFPFAGDSVVGKELQRGKFQAITVTKTIPASTPLSQPYWLQSPPEKGTFTVADQALIGQPENKPALEVSFVVAIGGEEITFAVPVLHRRTDRVLGELYRPFVIAPAVALNLQQRAFIFADSSSKEISVLVQANTPKAVGTVRLRLPEGWRATPDNVAFTLANKGDEMRAVFMVKPPQVSVNPDEYVVAEATVGTTSTTTVSKGMTTIAYTHIPAQTIFPDAKARLVRLELRKSVKTIGYIDGASDDVAEYLKQSGFAVTLLSDDEIETGNLSRYDAIVSGIRVYNDNARPRLRQQYRRLMDYVAEGGTMIVQYQLSSGLVTDSIGPYPFTISRDRVTEEDATVKFVKANHPVLTSPNVITAQDFEGWVQERGLYFANKWDDRYETLLSCNDAGEPEKKGGMLLARYGKGAFVYTGYAWFRELPAGVPGAYRLFVNLLHAGQTLNNAGTQPSKGDPKK
jgi:hypothetical protein